MAKFISICLVTITALVFFTSPAQSSSQELGTCVVDSLNGKERKLLAKWIFFGMAAHPEINKYSDIPVQDKLSTDQDIGHLITRLLTEDCVSELKVAMKESPAAIESAFEFAGQVAMMELMNNKKVEEALYNYANYINQKKFNQVIAK